MELIAYLIMAHQDPTHLERLVRALGEECDVYVHIDRKVPLKDFAFLRKYRNIVLTKDRIAVSWGGFSQVEAEMELLKAALRNGAAYSHLVFLSGSCYPIKPRRYISNFFLQNPDREFIKYIDMRNSPDHYMKHVSKKWHNELLIKSNRWPAPTINKWVRRVLSRLPSGSNHWDMRFVPYFGSQWVALTKNCAEYVLEFHLTNQWSRI
jgi:hypothetical protein